MKHGRFNELECSVAEFQFIACLDGLDLEVVAVMGDYGFFPFLGSDYRSILCFLRHHGQRAGMVHLNMVDYDVVDFVWARDVADIPQKLFAKRVLYRVDQHGFLVED